MVWVWDCFARLISSQVHSVRCTRVRSIPKVSDLGENAEVRQGFGEGAGEPPVFWNMAFPGRKGGFLASPMSRPCSAAGWRAALEAASMDHWSQRWLANLPGANSVFMICCLGIQLRPFKGRAGLKARDLGH